MRNKAPTGEYLAFLSINHLVDLCKVFYALICSFDV
jgi:hypothetical protein